MKTIGKIIGVVLLLGIASTSYGKGIEKMTDMKNPGVQDEKLKLTDEWDKVFPQSEKVDHSKVVFHNRFGITLAADCYKPKNASGKIPAIAISGPFGAVKEQSSGLYAQQLAERGFLTIAFDPSFTGESGGTPRFVASPDINTEDFSAAVDYLSNRSDVDPERIGIVGICGWGGLAINAAAIDTRIKATVAVTMYDMTRVTANGYNDANDNPRDRRNLRLALNSQRTKDYAAGFYELAGGVIDPLPDDAPRFVKDYFAYYKTPRGYHARSLNSNRGWNKTSALSFLNAKLLAYAGEIESPVMIVHGKRRTAGTSAKPLFKCSKATTRNSSSSPARCIAIFTTRRRSFLLTGSTVSSANISESENKQNPGELS